MATCSYDVLEDRRWPDAHLDVLEMALDVVRQMGVRGRGQYTFPVVLDLANQLRFMENVRLEMKRRAALDAENERDARLAMAAEEKWQRSMEKNLAAREEARVRCGRVRVCMCACMCACVRVCVCVCLDGMGWRQWWCGVVFVGVVAASRCVYAPFSACSASKRHRKLRNRRERTRNRPRLRSAVWL